jgi:hypothetical protein
VRASRDLARLDAFRRKYPGSPQALQATLLMADIQWEGEARNSKNPVILRRFRDRYPQSPHAAEALAAAVALERDAARTQIAPALRRLEAAYAARDIQQVRAVWPALSAARAARHQEFFRSVRSVSLRLEPSGDPQVTPDRIAAAARHIVTVQLPNGSRPEPIESRVVVRLARSGNAWVIEDLEYTSRGRSLISLP